MADDVFTQQNPVYYVGIRTQPENSPAFIAALTSALDALLAQSSANGGTLVTKTLNLTAQIGVPGQILAETAEIVIEAEGDTIRVGDDEFVVSTSVDLVVPFVASSLFTVASRTAGDIQTLGAIGEKIKSADRSIVSW